MSGWFSVKIDKADQAFSRYIRLKAKRCANCGRRGEGLEGITGLQASHYHTRRKESVRFDIENVDCLCAGCHKLLGTDDKPAYKAFKIKQLGQRGFDLLQLRAETYQRKDRKLSLLQAKMLLKTI